MAKLPAPLRNYQNIMLIAKRRFMFIDGFNDQKVDFIKVELIAVQLRKIIEGVAYGCISACQLGGENLTAKELNAYSAQKIFEILKKRNLNFVPTPCTFEVAGREMIEEWEIKKNGLPRSERLATAEDYLELYKELHQYAHEFHPTRGHRFLQKDGFDEAIESLRKAKIKLSNSIWQHFLPFGNRALLVDFGAKDSCAPETFVFSRSDKGASWPILYALAN